MEMYLLTPMSTCHHCTSLRKLPLSKADVPVLPSTPFEPGNAAFVRAVVVAQPVRDTSVVEPPYGPAVGATVGLLVGDLVGAMLGVLVGATVGAVVCADTSNAFHARRTRNSPVLAMCAVYAHC